MTPTPRTVHADPPRARLNLRGLDLATAQAVHDNAAQLRISLSELIRRYVALHANLLTTGHHAGLAFLCHANLATDVDLARRRQPGGIFASYTDGRDQG